MSSRITIVANTAWYLFNFRLGLINGLLNLGYEVITLAPEDETIHKLEDIGCHFINLPMDNKGLNPISDFRLRNKLESVYESTSPNLSMHYTIKPVIYGSMAAAQLGIPFVNNITGLGTAFIKKNWVTSLAKSLYKRSQKDASLVLFQNGEDKKLFEKQRLIPQSVQRKVVPGTGVNTEQFSTRLYHHADPHIFLLIARLIWDKGVGEFVEAAREVKKEFPEARFQLLGFLDVKNRTAVPRTEVNGWVEEGTLEYLGDTEDVRPYVEKAGCVVLPSYREGLPKTLLEAAAMGRPIIATNVTGCREIVQDGKNGFLCEAKDYLNLASKMKVFLQLPFKEKEKMGLKGRAIVEDRFDENKVVISILSEIEKLLLTKAKQ